MGMMATQISILTIVNSTVYSGADKKKISELCVARLCEGKSSVTGKIPRTIGQ